MDSNQDTLNLTQGMDVVGSDGDKVGSVQDVQGDYVVVSKGFFFPTDYYIPTSAINSADGDNVYLNVTKDEALNQGWDQVPETTASTTTYVEEEVITDPGLRVDNPVTGSTLTDTGYADTSTTVASDTDVVDTTVDRRTTVDTDDTIDVALTEEELTAQTRAVERGEVRIEKDVIEEERTLDVPITEEHVHVSRRVVDRDVRPGDATFEEGTIEVPVYGEEVEVEKRAHVYEELEIEKDTVQETEHVTGTVRREEARVVDDAHIVDDDAADRPNRR